LNRCALCLHEQWSESIEEAAKLFFQSKDPKGSAKILSDVYKTMLNPPKTMNEIHFHQAYRSELKEANKLLQDYLTNNNLHSFKEAWDIYHNCFRLISLNFATFESLDLEGLSPELFKFRESEIEIPGTYDGNEKLIKISSFSRTLTVLNSKQHPRRIVIYGSDEKEYPFLLKGHEDIRQDERVMQLFGLINTLLSKDLDTREKNLSIKRYPVIPLSHNTGIIGWVSNCDTFHQLIKDYRQINKVPLNIEHRLMAKHNPKFDTSLSMTKLEVFKYALDNTLGIDLYKVFWNKSKNAEDWLDRRTNYSRSLAVMSIVGYILGLGDRHPSNIMVDRISGKILHIDFGDCFEVAMKRDKFPEKVPFRLTRMLIKALEIGGIEGAFRITCENVMRVARENKDSLNVILAAFVHDPLISFRLLIPLLLKQAKNRKNSVKIKENMNNEDENKKKNDSKMMEEMINNKKIDENELEKKRMGSDERQLYNELEEKDDTESKDLNQIAKIVLDRISDKLNGSDFNKSEELKIYDQIQRLIKQATSHYNLSQSYLGWCPFW
jgi:FKBP12-rapamycin complex-associated protein